MSVIAPISASSIPSIHLSDIKCQEILEEIPGTNYGEKFLAEILAKIPDNITELYIKQNSQRKLLEILIRKFLSRILIWMKMGEIPGF